MDMLYMATHYPLPHHDHVRAYPEPEVFPVDMDLSDFQQPKPIVPHVPPPPATQYTSSPSLDSQIDDEERFFDADADFSHIQQSHPHQLVYDHMSAPSWTSIATPHAWVGEAHKVPALEPDVSPSFVYPQPPLPQPEGGVPQHQDSSNASSSSMPLYNLDNFLDNRSPAESPSTPYLSTPGSVGLTATLLPSAYYGADDSQSHSSPYTPVVSRYNTSLQAHDPGCDPRFVSPVTGSPHAGPSSSPNHQDVGISFADVYTDPSQHVKVEPDQYPITSGNILHQEHHQLCQYESDSGEDEKSESESDPSYIPSSSRSRPMSLPSASRMRPRHMRSNSAGSGATIGLGSDAFNSQRPTRTPAPEPVPNLTKKSRGRRVPTAASLYGGYSIGGAGSSSLGPGVNGKNARTYVCKVKECGKCFARSEHLKRHVRSIHTNEKPHRCPHSGCNKEFSRHDNLCQHMRVHRNFSAPKDGAFGSF